MSKVYPSSSDTEKSLFHVDANQTSKLQNETEIDCDDKIRDEQEQLLPKFKEKNFNRNNAIELHDYDENRMVERKWPSLFDDESAMKNKALPSLASNFEDIRNQLKRTGTILVRFVTWNQQGQPIPTSRDMTKYLFPKYFYHIIAVGTQECENSISKSLFCPSKQNWEKKCQEFVGGDYELVSGHALGGTHLALYVHRAILHLVKHVKSHAVPTGVCDKLGNKGGIAIAITIARSKFCFLTAHLAAHQNQIDRRIVEFARISKQTVLTLGSIGERNETMNDRGFSTSSDSEDQDCDTQWSYFCCRSNKPETNPLQDYFDFVFWGGDLNFRINGTRSVIDYLLTERDHNVLIGSDQLRMLLNFDKRFAGFSEGPLTFSPTYKFDKGTDIYDSSNKMRIPAWTDRILFKTNSSLDLLSYSSVMDIRTSDHRPVYATFQCRLDIDQHSIDKIDFTRRNNDWACESKSEVCVVS